MGQIEKWRPDDDDLRAQLRELNARSSRYSTQLWQIPFAYLGVTAVGFAKIESASHKELFWGSCAATVLGVIVLLHSLAVWKLEGKAIEKLKDVERQIGFPEEHTAERFDWDVLSTFALTSCGILFYLVLAGYEVGHMNVVP